MCCSPGSYSDDSETIDVFAFTRLAEAGDIFVAPANGTLKLEWDNHFSVVKTKTIVCQTRKLKVSE